MTNEDIPKWDKVPARPWDLFNKKIGRVSGEIAKERLDICKACPKYVKTTHQCLECGCIMNLKVKLPNAECPIGKWHIVEEDSE
jgi:hypothetical protein